MSQPAAPRLIVEWSPGQVVAYSPATGQTRSGATVAQAVAGLPLGDAVVALSRRASFVRATRVPNAGRDEVALVVRHQLGGLFPISGESLAYDFQLTEGVTGDGRLALVGAIQSEALRELLEECRSAGLVPRAVLPAALGAIDVAQRSGRASAAVVERTDSGLSIDVVESGVLRYSRWAALGPADSEEAIDAEVARTFVAAGVEPLPIVRAGEAGVESTLQALARLNLAHPPLSIELGEVRARRQARARARKLQLSGALLLAGLVSAGLVGYDYLGAKAAAALAVAGQERQIALNQSRSDQAKKDSAGAQAQLALVERGFSPDQRFWEVLAVLVKDAPQGVWLTGVTMERGKPFTIRGAAVSTDVVTAYADVLAAEDRLRDVKLLYDTGAQIANRPVQEFSISGFPIGNLPLVDPNAKAGAPAAGGTSS